MPTNAVLRGWAMATVGELAAVLDRLWPVAWAEPWDNVGLLVGDHADSVQRCLCALDADTTTVADAVAAGAQMLLTHHPLPFRPLRRLTAEDPTGRGLLLAARSRVAIYAAHTNFDVHPEGVNRALADALGLRAAVPLRITGREALYKLVVFVPAGHEDAVRDALADAGAGHLGRYSHCTFAAPGTGTFRPLSGARPFVGHVGTTTRQSELRLEALVTERCRGDAVQAMLRAHPYEEVAYDLVRLENDGPARGLGLVGDLARARRLSTLAAFVGRRLRAPATRLVGDPARIVRRVAVCGGAGAELAAPARAAGAEVLITADVRYHEAREAEASGLALIDPGHQATEAPAVPVLAAGLQRAAAAAGCPVEVLVQPPRQDVWRAVGGRGGAG